MSNLDPIQIGTLLIDFAKQRITRGMVEIHLTRTEWKVLTELALARGNVVAHQRMLQRVWGPNYNDETEYVHTYMRLLRKKLEPDPSNPVFLLTESGYGYRLDVGRDELPAAALRSSAAHLINPLPMEVGARYVGREREMTVLRALLRERTRLISVYGRAGEGKTALVCKVLHDLAYETSDGDPVKVVSISAVHASITLPRIFAALQELVPSVPFDTLLSDIQTPAQRAAAVLSMLYQQGCILFLDNLDAVQDASTGALLDEELRAFIETVLTQGGGIRLIITSRDPLLLPLSLNTWERRVVLRDGLSAAEGAALLRMCDPDGSAGLRDAPDEALRALVNRAHGNPRVLENIAGLLLENRLLTPANLVESPAVWMGEIETEIAQRALQRLDEGARRLLQMAALLNRPFTQQGIAPFASVFVPLELQDTALRRLVRGFFLHYNRETGEFDMHPTDQAFCAATIPTYSDDGFFRVALHRLAAQHCLNLSESAGQLAALELKTAAFFHFVSAEMAVEAAELVLALDRDLLSSWGYYARLREMYSAVLALLNADSPTIKRLRCACVLRLGKAYRGVGRSAEAVPYYEAGLALARALNAPDAEAEALRSLGWSEYDQGHLQSALEYWQACLSGFRALGDRAGEASTLGGLGWGAYLRGDYSAAIGYFEAALSLYRALNDESGVANNLGDLGEVYAALGDYSDAVEYLRQAVSLAEMVEARREQSYKRGYLAAALLQSREYQRALDAIYAARQIDLIENNHMIAALHGIILTCLDRRTEASNAFEDAIRAADSAIAAMPTAYRAHYARALAGSGLQLLDVNRLGALDVHGDWERATAICAERGVLEGYQRLMDKLIACAGGGSVAAL